MACNWNHSQFQKVSGTTEIFRVGGLMGEEWPTQKRLFGNICWKWQRPWISNPYYINCFLTCLSWRYENISLCQKWWMLPKSLALFCCFSWSVTLLSSLKFRVLNFQSTFDLKNSSVLGGKNGFLYSNRKNMLVYSPRVWTYRWLSNISKYLV